MRPEWYKILSMSPKEKDKDYDRQLTRNVMCSCKKEYSFLSQKDDDPEYYTFIHLHCECGNLIRMKFPVN